MFLSCLQFTFEMKTDYSVGFRLSDVDSCMS